MPSLAMGVPSHTDLRTKLEDMVIRDLLGPAGGPEEEIAERRVRDRYLVGVLAPAGTASEVDPRTHVPDGVMEAWDDLDAYGPSDEGEIPSLVDPLFQGGGDTSEDGKADLDVPVQQACFPSSFSMTFCVDAPSVDEIEVEARWGQYLRETGAEIDEKTGRPKRVWRRYPRGGSTTLLLREAMLGPISVDAESPEVYVQAKVRRRDSFWVVTLFLVNGQTEDRPKDAFHVFQPELAVRATDGAPIFVKGLRYQSPPDTDPAARLEEETLSMLYRRRLEFAVGHGVSVHVEQAPGNPQRAVSVRTAVVPASEVWRTTPPTCDDAERNPAFGKLMGLVLDMKALAETPQNGLRAALSPLVEAYTAWIDGERRRLADPAEGLADLRDAAEDALRKCQDALKRIQAGLDLLETDGRAFEAFRFMNRAMWLQRTHSIFSGRVRKDADHAPDFDREVDVPANRTWYPFQLAFVLLNLPALTLLDHPDRGPDALATADLLFFPTGGGKTEAYLGLSAYTLGIRRLQGTVAGRDGEHGVAVLMRYTLRVLTIQQFQRATALVCACEEIRRKALESGDDRWGRTPFRIGLWVGRRTTPNWNKHSAEAVRQMRDTSGYVMGGLGSPYQITACPWCGTKIEPGKHIEVRPYENGTCKTTLYCGDKFGQCLFSRRHSPGEGLPVLVVDEEIYRRLPSVLIATVDKFAQMPWKGEVQMLFGQVDGRCPRHGFRSPEIQEATSHKKSRDGLPGTTTAEHLPLRPPDLIVQDELHLISGPLGSLVGLYETAIDRLCTWEVGDRRVRPKVVASTATIRNADVQVRQLFLRRVSVFPPAGVDVEDDFFSVQRDASNECPGRRYIGICAPGRRLKATLIRVYVAHLCAAQSLYEQYGVAVDPWMTLAGYFNSMRELGGMRRLVDDDVYTRARQMDRRGLARRFFTTDYLEELTSRMRSEQIPVILDRLETPFDPDLAEKRREMIKQKKFDKASKRPVDVLLATNMISVGVDVQRLGLMVVAGQPKSTAEYIQATSRVGRSKPGLVCTVYNWARPRDLSHYETFEHYHATFYKQVEPLSVTPFSPGALSRGLAGLLVSLVRLRGVEFNPNGSANRVQKLHPYVQEAIEAIAERAEQIGDGVQVGDLCRAELKAKMDIWQGEAQNVTGGRQLHYTDPRGAARGTAVPLLHHPDLDRWDEFTCLDSLRDVEPEVKLVIDDHGLDEYVGAESASDGTDASS